MAVPGQEPQEAASFVLHLCPLAFAVAIDDAVIRVGFGGHLDNVLGVVGDAPPALIEIRQEDDFLGDQDGAEGSMVHFWASEDWKSALRQRTVPSGAVIDRTLIQGASCVTAMEVIA
jgi:hypothetical protein